MSDSAIKIIFSHVETNYNDYGNSVYSDVVLDVSSISELTPTQKDALFAELNDANIFRESDILEHLRQAKSVLSKRKFDAEMLKLGYLPIVKAKKIPEINVDPSTIYYRENGYLRSFDITKNNYEMESALKSKSDIYFAQIDFDENHPFMKMREKYKNEQEEKKIKSLEKKRLRDIKRAKKILKENGEKI